MFGLQQTRKERYGLHRALRLIFVCTGLVQSNQPLSVSISHKGLIDLMTWTWWRHQMKTLSALLAICAGNSPVTGVKDVVKLHSTGSMYILWWVSHQWTSKSTGIYSSFGYSVYICMYVYIYIWRIIVLLYRVLDRDNNMYGWNMNRPPLHEYTM